jgi:hypothetical protein
VTPKRTRYSLGKVIAGIFICLLFVGGGVFIIHQNKDKTGAKPVVHLSASPSRTGKQENFSYLERAINSNTVVGQRQALALEIRQGLTRPMFPPRVKGNRTTVKVETNTFTIDSDNTSSATVEATLSNELGTYELRLVREQGKWLIVYTTKVKK